MNSQKDILLHKGKIVRPCSKRNDMKTRKRNTCTHVPTIRCHEEIMSKLSNYNSDSDDCDRAKPLNNYSGKTKAIGSKKLICSKAADLYETESAPMCLEKNMARPNCFSTSRSKSVPLTQKSKLDDSVDTIPVKLNSNNGNKVHKKNSKEKNNFNVKSKEKMHKGPTWDQIFKKETDVRNISKGVKNNHDEHESLPNTPKKKVSIKIANKNCENGYRPLSNDDNLYNRPSSDSPNSIESLPLEQICSYDPVKTLDLLIKQMRGKLSNQPESSNLQKIIFDMESALQKISAENEGLTKIIQDNNVKLFLNEAQKSTFSNRGDIKGSDGQLDVITLQRGLEESCLILQQLCIKQKENCQSHVREKEQIALQLAESRRLLAIAKSKERDYEATIGELRLKIHEANTRKDQQFQSSEKITDIESKLKSECKRVEALKVMVQKLKSQLEDNARQTKELSTQLYLKDLEIEKLKVLIETKEQNTNEPSEENLDDLNLPVYKVSDEDDSFSSDSPLQTAHERIMCSSQASSSPRHSPSPYNSWLHISSINEQTNRHLQHDFRMNNFQIPKLDLEMPTSGSDIWNDR